MSTEPSKVIKMFPEQSQPFYDFLDELRDYYDKGLLQDFVCLYDYKHEENDPAAEYFTNGINNYWFSNQKSCGELLGLLIIMQDIIMQYIRSQCEIYNDVFSD